MSNIVWCGARRYNATDAARIACEADSDVGGVVEIAREQANNTAALVSRLVGVLNDSGVIGGNDLIAVLGPGFELTEISEPNPDEEIPF